MKFKIKLSVNIERSNALDRALRKQGFEIIPDDQSETELSEVNDDSVPFGFASQRIF